MGKKETEKERGEEGGMRKKWREEGRKEGKREGRKEGSKEGTREEISLQSEKCSKEPIKEKRTLKEELMQMEGMTRTVLLSHVSIKQDSSSVTHLSLLVTEIN